MANSSGGMECTKFFQSLRQFPTVINDQLNAIGFLDASQDLILVVDRLGKAVAPVRYDMQGNIDKIRKYFELNDDSCLLELMINEKTTGKPGTESVVWLNRALLFFELTFQELAVILENKQLNVPIKKVLNVAYEGSVKRYHNWITQQLFSFICKLAPTLPQFLRSIEADEDLDEFRTTLINFNLRLHLVRCKIDDVIKENNLYND